MLEVLRETRRGKRCTTKGLWNNAEMCHGANVMRPYLESRT